MRPPPSLTEVQISLMGAWRLFRRDPSGLALLGRDEEAFWKSFWCAVVVAPAYIALLALIPDAIRIETSFPRLISVEIIAYVIGWVAWPLVVHIVFGVLGIRDKFIPYIVAYNWSAGPQIAVFLTIALIAVTFNLSLDLFLMMNLVAFIWLLAYHGYIAKVSAEVNAGTVVFLVLGEAVLSFLINWARDIVMVGFF